MFIFQRVAVITGLVLAGAEVSGFHHVNAGYVLWGIAVVLAVVSVCQWKDLEYKKRRLNDFIDAAQKLEQSFFETNNFLVFELQDQILAWAQPVRDFLRRKMPQYPAMFYRGINQIERERKIGKWDSEKFKQYDMDYHSDKNTRYNMRERYADLIADKADYLGELAAKLGI